MRVIIERLPEGGTGFAHMQPLVDAMIQDGNRVKAGWMLEKDGWSIYFADPIDFDMVSERFDLPASIRVAREQDGILCELTWSQMCGGSFQAPNSADLQKDIPGSGPDASNFRHSSS